MNAVTELAQFVGQDVINKNTTGLAVRCSTGSVELSCVAINTPLGRPVFCTSQVIGCEDRLHNDLQCLEWDAAW